jgi:predicted 3-demethylubiquinone-9 3-methyltransferase (glyoxalase superfamily)
MKMQKRRWTLTFPFSENSKVGRVRRYEDAGPGPKGAMMTGAFRSRDKTSTPSTAVPVPLHSGDLFFVNCETQQEVDDLWEKLSAGGEEGQCGWIKDKFGVSWQIIPSALGERMGNKDPKKSPRVMQAMLGMTKIDIKGL